jgi:lipoate-protein ligase A
MNSKSTDNITDSSQSWHHWNLQRDASDIAWLCLDKQDSTVNVLSQEVLAELEDVLSVLENRLPKGLVVFSGKEKGFIAGADINEFPKLTSERQAYELTRRGHRLFDRLESLRCPTVAFINGFALGGGLEFALACDWRIGTDADRPTIGLPEVQLGLHPGFGGTVRTVRLLEVHTSTLVLGSSQADAVVDTEGASRAGLDVARRRSGGGAVLLVPGDHVWIDFWVPRGDELWHDDIVRAADWVGDTWVQALKQCCVADLEVHRGGLEARRWSELVCFTGLGPGEVTAGRHKYVGVSQRRTREWIRVQTMVHRRFRADLTVAGLRLSAEQRRAAALELARVVGVVGEAPVTESVLASLPT